MEIAHKTETFHFDEDGNVPNNRLAVVLHHRVFGEQDRVNGDLIESTFNENGWTNSWRGEVYDYHHFHSNCFEALGVYQGTALLLIGGEHGQKLQVRAGDILILPPGTGHKSLEKSEDFKLVAGYPDGVEYDLMKADEMTEAKLKVARANIGKVPIARTDPWLGTHRSGATVYWQVFS